METNESGSNNMEIFPMKEWHSRSRHPSASMEDLEIELCDICRKINWHAALLDCCPDLTQNDWPYRWADIPTFRQMETRQLHCSFCRLCVASRKLRPSLRKSSFADTPLQIVWYARNLRYRPPWVPLGKDKRRQKNIKRAELMGFRLFVQQQSIGSWTMHLNMQYVPLPLFQLMPAAEEVPLHRKQKCGQRVPVTQADPTLFKRWIDCCRLNHGATCNMAYSGFQKTEWSQLADHLRLQFHFRVIDVQQRKIVDAPRDCSFVALSYVWGQLQGVHRARKCDLKPIPESSDKMYLDIPNEGIPQTVQNAMQVTATLGQQFLWVDALCIIQDDPAELSATLQAMDMVYAAADVVIVASSGLDANAGLPGAFPRSRMTCQPSEKICGITTFLETQPLSEVLASSCWRTRAWTYQEEYFSTRLLVFSDNNVYFKCRMGETCEDIVTEDTHTQSYFLESGSNNAVWLRAQDRSSAEDVCNHNAISLEIMNRENLQAKDSRLPCKCHPHDLHAKHGPHIDSIRDHEGYKISIASDHHVSSSSHWKVKTRLWLEMHQNSLSKEFLASPAPSVPSTTRSDVALQGGEEPIRPRTARYRRQSTTSFSLTLNLYEPHIIARFNPSNSSSSQAVTSYVPSRDTDHAFYFTIPKDIDVDKVGPLTPQSKSLAGFKWMAPKALSTHYQERKVMLVYSRMDKREIEVTRDRHPRKKKKVDNFQVDNELVKQYAIAVREFTPRSLTKQSDILNAFKGITNHFGRLMGTDFVYGLPIAAFDASLLWRDAEDWELKFGDWTFPWRTTGSGAGTTYTHRLEDLKLHRKALRDNQSRGCVKSSIDYEDCDAFPTWSWCGWKGSVRYHDDQFNVLELKSQIIWPWKPEYIPPENTNTSMQSKVILQVEAEVAIIDLLVLERRKKPDIFWGWAVENGQRIREGLVECVLLSTGIGSYLNAHKVDPIPELFHNILIIGRDQCSETVYRRGVAQLYPEDWELFMPRREWIYLR
jgi:hypothetical protein